MIFSASLSLGLAVLFLGGAFGSSLCLIIAKFFKKKYQKCRFSLICVFFSFSIALVSVFLIFVQKKYSFNLIYKNTDDIKFLVILFILGCLLSAFWKYILIPFFIVYFFISVHTFNFFSSRFYGYSDTISINVKSPEDVLSIRVYKIPSKFLFFTNRFHYDISFDGFKDGGDSVSNNWSLYKENCNFLQKKLDKLDKWLLKNFEIQKIEIPTAHFYPSLYVLKFNSKFDNFMIDINRTL